MLKRTFIGLIQSQETTGEKVKDPTLKTRYYNISKEQAMEEVANMFKKLSSYKLLYEVKNVGELVVERKTFTGRIQDITLTFVGVSPVKTAIDIYSASRGSLGDLGANYRVIQDIYRHIDKRLAAYKLYE